MQQIIKLKFQFTHQITTKKISFVAHKIQFKTRYNE